MAWKIFRFALAGALAAVSGLASAQSSCDSAVYWYSYYLEFGPPSSAQYYLENYPECFGGSQTTAQTQISGTSFQQISAISSALSARLLFSGAGGPAPRADAGVKSIAAGGTAKAWNIWTNLSSSDTRQSYRAGASSIKNNSDILTGVVGGDYSLSPTMVVGVSAAFDRGDGSGDNNGAVNALTSEGYTVAPYLGMQLTKELVLDVTGGLGEGKLRTGGNTNAESDRWFGGANLSYGQWLGNMQLTGKLSYMHAEEKYGNTKSSTCTGGICAGTAAKNKIDQMRLAFQAGYWMNGIMPYAGLAYSADVRRTTTQAAAPADPIGKDAWVWTVGVNFFSLASGVTGGIAYNQEDGRTNQKNNSLMANINLRF